MIMAAALFVAGVAMTGCQKNDPQEPARVQTYKMSIQAGKGTANQANGPKKALGLDGEGGISATWGLYDVVNVYKSASLVGQLYAQSAGASTRLEGALEGEINPGDVLTLKFLSPDYTDQDGTLEYIATHCDFATASVEVASIDGSGNITTTADAAFANQQAIVKFTLQDEDGNAITPTSLTINDETSDIATVTSISASIYSENGGDGILYVAVPGFSSKTITLSATVGDDIYTYERSSVTFADGEFYAITVKMEAPAEGPDVIWNYTVIGILDSRCGESGSTTQTYIDDTNGIILSFLNGAEYWEDGYFSASSNDAVFSFASVNYTFKKIEIVCVGPSVEMQSYAGAGWSRKNNILTWIGGSAPASVDLLKDAESDDVLSVGPFYEIRFYYND